MTPDRINQNAPRTEEQQKIYIRTWDDGSYVSSIKDRVKPESIWHITNDFRARTMGETNLIETHFTLPERPESGAILEFDGRHFQVTNPQFPHLGCRFGATSIFVKPLSEDEYRKLTAKKQP